MEFLPSKDLMLSCPLVIVILVWAHVLRKLCVCMCVCVPLCVCECVWSGHSTTSGVTLRNAILQTDKITH